MAFDLIIRGGTVVDGTGAPARPADVGAVDGRIAAVEPMLRAEAKEIIDATGRIVTPGFVDLHGHYDGQMTWDDLLEPSTPHGVTTLIMGNCGVGFAPVRPGQEGELARLHCDPTPGRRTVGHRDLSDIELAGRARMAAREDNTDVVTMSDGEPGSEHQKPHEPGARRATE